MNKKTELKHSHAPKRIKIILSHLILVEIVVRLLAHVHLVAHHGIGIHLLPHTHASALHSKLLLILLSPHLVHSRDLSHLIHLIIHHGLLIHAHLHASATLHHGHLLLPHHGHLLLLLHLEVVHLHRIHLVHLHLLIVHVELLAHHH